jgi:hypothetical protein
VAVLDAFRAGSANRADGTDGAAAKPARRRTTKRATPSRAKAAKA